MAYVMEVSTYASNGLYRWEGFYSDYFASVVFLYTNLGEDPALGLFSIAHMGFSFNDLADSELAYARHPWRSFWWLIPFIKRHAF